MRGITKWVAAASLALVATASPAQNLRVGITGSASDGPQNPHQLLNNLQVQKLIAEASRGALPSQRVARLLNGAGVSAEDLVAAGLLKKGRNSYSIALNYYSVQDQEAIQAVVIEASSRLANRLLQARPRFEAILSRYDLDGPKRGDVAMALLGCVILDWDGLAITEKNGLRLSDQKHPNGGVYTAWAREKTAPTSVRGLYWGSHNAEAKAGWITTFGDHDALPRAGFPDLAWHFNENNLSSELSKEVRAALIPVVSTAMDQQAENAASLMLAMRDGPKDVRGLATAVGLGQEEALSTLNLLIALGYVQHQPDGYRAAIPVFTRRDHAMIEELRGVASDVVLQWLRTEYPQLRTQLSGLSAIKAGVPFEALFTDIWHDLFGWTNYRLVQSGMFNDPYGPSSRFRGFVPFVWARDLALL